MASADRATVVIGLGSPNGDDAVGWCVVQEVEQRLRDVAGISCVTLSGDPARLIDAWDGADVAVVVDAFVVPGRPPQPGSLVTLDLSGGRPMPPAMSGTSTHGMGLETAVELAVALDRMPGMLLFIGVEIESVPMTLFPEDGLSAAVSGAVTYAAESVVLFVTDAPIW